MAHITPNLQSIVSPDGAAILDVANDTITTLNPVGGYVWNKLRQGKMVEETIRDLSLESNTDPVIVERDVREFLDQLMAKHLVHL